MSSTDNGRLPKDALDQVCSLKGAGHQPAPLPTSARFAILADAINRISAALNFTPNTELGESQMMRLAWIVADADMTVSQIIRMLQRHNAGEVLSSLIDRSKS